MMTPHLFTSSAFGTTRLGVIMAPDTANPHEVGGVLNPGGVTGPDGAFYLFPRLVGAHNYSRIGLARVVRDATGAPQGVERLGIALAPREPYEIVRAGVGGCEDPRVTALPSRGRYLMVYTAMGVTGVHLALASSRDLRTWTRHGLVNLAPHGGTAFNRYTNKDGMLLPRPVRAPDGTLALALLHRPIYEHCQDATTYAHEPAALPVGIGDARPSMWISYCPLTALGWLDGGTAPTFGQHTLLAVPEAAWEAYRIGGGTVPLLTAAGWLTFYHGVTLQADGGRCYQTGALLLDRWDPRQILARSCEPLFGPAVPEEQVGMVNNVVFPTAVEERAGGMDVYYGMADSRIGVVHLRHVEARQVLAA